MHGSGKGGMVYVEDVVGNVPSVSSGEVSLLMVVRYLLSKWYWLLLAGIAAGFLTFGAVKAFVTPSYQSSVSFYVYNTSDNSAATRSVNSQDLQAAESLATTYSKILASNTVLDAVLDDMGDSRNGLTRSDLSSMVNASVVTDTQLLKVEVSSSDPEFACRIAQSFQRVAPDEMQRITKVGGVEIVDQPEVAKVPTSPRIGFDTVIGATIGIIIAAIALGMHALKDQTIYVPEDLEGKVTVLGAIPRIETASVSDRAWKITIDEKADHANES